MANTFSLLCKKYIIEHRKNILMFCTGYLGLFVIFGILTGLTGNTVSDTLFWMYVVIAGPVCAGVASKMFAETTTKEGSIALLMTPASSGEKFSVRLLAVLPCVVAVTVIGYIVFGYTSILVAGMRYGFWYPLYLPPVSSTYGIETLFLLISLFLFIESGFIFGSVVWPKRSFPKTLCCFAGLLIIFGFLMWVIIKICRATGIYFEVVDQQAFTWSIISIIFALAICLTIFSFFRFKKKMI